MVRMYEHAKPISEIYAKYLVKKVYSKPLKETTLMKKFKENKFSNYEIY